MAGSNWPGWGKARERDFSLPIYLYLFILLTFQIMWLYYLSKMNQVIISKIQCSGSYPVFGGQSYWLEPRPVRVILAHSLLKHIFLELSLHVPILVLLERAQTGTTASEGAELTRCGQDSAQHEPSFWAYLCLQLLDLDLGWTTCFLCLGLSLSFCKLRMLL